MKRCWARKPSSPLSPTTLRIFSAKTGVYSIQCPSPSMTGCESLARICSGLPWALIMFSRKAAAAVIVSWASLKAAGPQVKPAAKAEAILALFFSDELSEFDAVVGGDHLRCLLADHDRRRVGVPAD